MLLSLDISIEGRVSELAIGALEVGTKEKQDIKKGFQIVGNAVFYSIDE
jgi:hypothetical protein